MKLIFLYLVVGLCVFCKDGEALFYKKKSGEKIAERTSGKQKRQLADNTNPRSRAGFSSSVSGNLGFGLGAPDPKGLGIGRADWSAMSSRGSAGGESVGFGFNARSSVGTGSFGWELGKRKGNAAFGFGASGSSSFGGSGGNGKIKIEGSQMSSSGGPVPQKLGDTSLRNQNTLVGDSSGKSETNLGVSDEQGFGINEIGGNRMNGSRSAGAGFKGFGSDAGSSVEKSSSFHLRHGERKREVDLGDSGSNRFDDIGLSENVIKGTRKPNFSGMDVDS